MTEWQPTSRGCFVCGRDNLASLGARWWNDRATGEVRAEVVVADHFNGYPGVVHGGVVAALLDETAGRTLLLDGGFDDLMVTLKLEVTYRQPTPTATPLTLVGRLLERGERRAHAEAELRLPDGALCAQASVVLARPPEGMKARWDGERDHWRV